MQRRFDNINDTFEDYENNFMGPTKMREGRMHAIEVKLKEQEDSRETEFKYMKFLLNKMLIAFEHSIFVSGHHKIIPSKSVIYNPPSDRIETDRVRTEAEKDNSQDEINEKAIKTTINQNKVN